MSDSISCVQPISSTSFHTNYFAIKCIYFNVTHHFIIFSCLLVSKITKIYYYLFIIREIIYSNIVTLLTHHHHQPVALASPLLDLVSEERFTIISNCTFPKAIFFLNMLPVLLLKQCCSTTPMNRRYW